jgi:hypothetical protein
VEKAWLEDQLASGRSYESIARQTGRHPSTVSYVTRSLARARDEARKCVLLCANCHAEVEGGFTQLPLRSADSRVYPA